MRIQSIKKWSVLGVVLTLASAVTAAMLPSSKDSDQNFANGSLTASSDTVGNNTKLTCTVDATQDFTQACNISASGTTEQGNSSHGNDADSSDAA